MRLHLTGTRAFGAAVLDAALTAGHAVTAVTAPLPAWRDGRERPDRLAHAAHAAGVPVYPGLTPDTVRHHRADVVVAAHSHAIVGARTRSAVAAAIGYHPSLLPLHRGRDAVRWTIRDRDRVTGGTVYHLTDRVDGGPIAAQDYVLTRPDDTPRSLWDRDLAPLGVRLLLATLADLDAGRIVAVPQDEALATWEPARDTPPLHRPELLELTDGRTPTDARWTVTADREHVARAHLRIPHVRVQVRRGEPVDLAAVGQAF